MFVICIKKVRDSQGLVPIWEYVQNFSNFKDYKFGPIVSLGNLDRAHPFTSHWSAEEWFNNSKDYFKAIVSNGNYDLNSISIMEVSFTKVLSLSLDSDFV